MNQTPPFIPSDVADRLIQEDDAEARARGAMVVALQLDHSIAFVQVLVGSMVVGGGSALWLHSWNAVIYAVVFVAFIYYRLFISTGREVAKAGILPELQAAYKRLYYVDATFKKQVDDLRANNK